jgi:predicted dehydrogenase
MLNGLRRKGVKSLLSSVQAPKQLPKTKLPSNRLSPNFRGRGYCDLREMLEKERPDAVSVCSPHHLHAEHCLEALRHGVHVLCEKPLVWLGQDKLDESLEQTRKVVNEAKERGLKFAVNTQYAASVPHLRQIWGEQGLPQIPERITLTMEAKMRERDTSGVNLWVDLAPHPLSILLALFPDADLELDDIEFEESADSLSAHFSIRWQNNRIPVTVRTRRHSGELERSVSWGEFKTEFVPFVGEDGIYRIRIKWDKGERIVEDFMQVSIRQFVKAVLGEGMPLCDAETAMKQMKWLIALVRKYLTMRRW